MDNYFVEYISKLELGRPRSFNNMAVIPLFSSAPPGPRYLTMKEALEGNFLEVTELTERGNVLELRVVNRAELPVLLLDGEELEGAKQNRILNTTVLVKKRSETVIPVSCTEEGRWWYRSRKFSDSGNVLFYKARVANSRSVAASLEFSEKFRTNQGQLWNNIAELQHFAKVSSPTAAMKDVFQANQKSLQQYLEAFPCQEHQKGLVAAINGSVVGCDILSRDSAYKCLHEKLIKSYALEAMVLKKARCNGISEEMVEIFFGLARACREKSFKSVGLGWDYRFTGEGIVGSALVYRKKALHLAFFSPE